MRTAVIFGVTGQDGSYLAELLLDKGYRVIGVSRRVSVPTDQRIRHLASDKFMVVRGDVTDPFSVKRVIEQVIGRWLTKLEIYNLAAQSHVGVSFEEPTHTTNVTYLGCLNILEAVRSDPYLIAHCRVYQASSSEMFGGSYDRDCNTREMFQCEDTPMLPNSPYAIAKLSAHHACRVYRESYGLFACSGILFNHESERRGEQFVTKKIAKWAAGIHGQLREGASIEALLKACPDMRLKLGNLDSKRDWGHAEDYVRGMWMMLQQEKPDDYVLATGETHSVREFLNEAIQVIGVPAGVPFDCLVETDPLLLRPCEVPFLRGDSSKARQMLGWAPAIGFKELVQRMVQHEIEVLNGSTSA